MRVLVTGGAGYIGSVVVEELLADGHHVTVLDNLGKGHAAAVAPEAAFVRADLHERGHLRELLAAAEIEAVVHMAADSLVGESTQDPGKYYRSNVVGGLGLLDAMVETGVLRLVFSSTAAVYGEPEVQPIDETAPTRPTNPYGETKLAFERALPWYERAHGLRFASLRYFNAAGASGRCGEDHEPETHLIPLVLQAAAGRLPHVTVFGAAVSRCFALHFVTRVAGAGAENEVARRLGVVVERVLPSLELRAIDDRVSPAPFQR